jgi:DNA-binding GntR family transcriptional regulator
MPPLTPPTNGKVDHGLLRQKIVENLLADVFGGELAAGRRLVTQELAERFKVSHTPVREALIALAGIGIIDLVPNRGAIVRRVTSKEVREVMQVRLALECAAVRLACGRIDLEELELLAADLKRLASAKNFSPVRFVERSRNTDSRLHDLVASSCGNRFLANELNRLKTLFRAFRDVSYTQEQERNDFRRLAREALEHLAIVEALRSGDRRDAVRAMSRHLLGGIRYWTRVLPDAMEVFTQKRQNARFKRNGTTGNGATK